MIRLRSLLLPALAILLALRPTTAHSQQAAVHSRIVGVVWDSVSVRPLPGATVRIVRADDPSIGRSALSDSVGKFQIDSVESGSWLASFLHPVTDSLRFDPAVLRIAIIDSAVVSLTLATPSARTLVGMICGRALAHDLGVITGEIRGASDDALLANAAVSVEWPEWVLQKGKMITEQRRIVAKTDTLGSFAMCGVPAGSTLRAVSWSGADSTGAIEVSVSDAGYARQDFSIAAIERVRLAVDSTTDSALVTTVRRGRAIIRGRVTTTDGRPLSNAVVRIIGSGSQVRTAVDGAFVVSDAGAGTQAIEARAIGYQPYRKMLALRESGEASVLLALATQQVSLDTVRVIAGRTMVPVVRAIERRSRTGLGKTLDAAFVRDRAVLFVTDALRGINGVTVHQVGGFGQAVMMREITGKPCFASIFVDAIRVQFQLSTLVTIDDLVRPSDIAAIEVYPRATMAPAEFLTMDTGCGVVAVWTKRHTEGVVPDLGNGRKP
jgi:Carboxypeptidase regulatory-like domain